MAQLVARQPAHSKPTLVAAAVQRTPSLRHGTKHAVAATQNVLQKVRRRSAATAKKMADAPIARLRAKARADPHVDPGPCRAGPDDARPGEVLAQFATLQSQFDELRNDIATSRVLQYFAFVPGEDPGPAAGEIPNLFSVRETPAMEAQAAEEAQLPPTNLSASRIHDHNRLVDDVVQALAGEAEARREATAREHARVARPGRSGVATACLTTPACKCSKLRPLANRAAFTRRRRQ